MEGQLKPVERRKIMFAARKNKKKQPAVVFHGCCSGFFFSFRPRKDKTPSTKKILLSPAKHLATPRTRSLKPGRNPVKTR